MPMSLEKVSLYDNMCGVIQTKDPSLICRFFEDHREFVQAIFPENEIYGNFSGVTPLFGAILYKDLDLVRCLLQLNADFDFFSNAHNISAGQLYIHTFPVEESGA